VNFETTVLEGDWAEVIRPVGACFLQKKDDVGFVDGPQVRSDSMEVIESLEKISSNKVPIFLKKVGPKLSGPGLELSFMEKRASLISVKEKG
jgi:hypothetical protein